MIIKPTPNTVNLSIPYPLSNLSETFLLLFATGREDTVDNLFPRLDFGIAADNAFSEHGTCAHNHAVPQHRFLKDDTLTDGTVWADDHRATQVHPTSDATTAGYDRGPDNLR